MNMLKLLFFAYPFFLIISELLIKYQKYVYSFAFTLIWVLIFILILIKTKPIHSRNKDEIKVLEKHFAYKKILTSLLAIPILILIIIAFPFKNLFSYDLFIVYCIFAAMTGIYLMNYRVHFIRVGHHFNGIRYLIFGIFLILIVALLDFKYLGIDYKSLNFKKEMFNLLIIAFVSYISVLYFRGILQNFLHSLFNEALVIFFISLILVIIEIPSFTIISLLNTLIGSLTIGYVYSRSRNIFIVFILEFILNILLTVLPSNHGVISL